MLRVARAQRMAIGQRHLVWRERRDRDEEVAKVAESDVRIQVSRDQSHPRSKRGPACETRRDQRDLERAAMDDRVLRTSLVGDEPRELPALLRGHVARVGDGLLPPTPMHLFAGKRRTVCASVAEALELLG